MNAFHFEHAGTEGRSVRGLAIENYKGMAAAAIALATVLTNAWIMPPSAWADTLEYRCDSMQRLTQAHYGDGTVVDFVYDNLGNRLLNATTVSGAPSNQPPTAVTNPSIANGVTNVPTTATLSWSPAVDPNSGDSVVYFIYFGTSATPPLACSGWTTNWSPGKLRGWTTYYWQIVARDSHNAQTASPVWNFTTGNEPPVADFVASSAGGWAPLAVTFTDRSFDTDNVIVSWQWDFDNNGTVDSTNRNPTFTYTPPGDYTVRLTVRDEAGATNAAVKTNLISIIGNNIVDLAPLGLSIESATSYRNLLVRYAITNRGTISLSGKWQWADTFYVSTNTVLDAAAIQIATLYENQSLPAGAVYARTNLVAIPYVAAQNYYLLLKADGQNRIGEISEGNNIVAIPLSGRLPDLVAGGFSFSSNAIAGTEIQVVCAITNLGQLNLEAEWYDGVYLSTNAGVDAEDVLCGSFYVSSELLIGEGYTYTNTVLLPGRPPGNYYLILVADDFDLLVEADEQNNALSVPIVLRAPDLAPVALSAPGAAVSQETIPVSWAVTNLGTGAAQPSWYDTLYLSTNSVWDEQDIQLNAFGWIELVSGSYTQQVDVQLAGVPDGNYYLILKADGYNSLFESNETNNERAVPIMISTPDLMPFGLSAPGAAVSQEMIPVNWAVTNLGTGAAQPSWYDVLYLSTNSVWDEADIQLNASGWSEAVSGSYTQEVQVQLAGVPDGNYYLILKVDGYNYLFESNETNNKRAVPIRLIGDRPLLEAALSINGQPILTLYGPTNLNYTLDSATQLATPISWVSHAYVVITSSSCVQVIKPLDATNHPIFFRARRDP